MISDARGGHVSPGVYTEVRDVTYSTKSLGITTLGVAGETLKGPAFQPISIASWTDFTDYFGGTSPIKFKGTNYPKYELPYIAKAYLEESKQLEVVRVLGLSGYWAGTAWVIKANETPVVVLRSKKSISGATEDPAKICQDSKDNMSEIVTSMSIGNYTVNTYTAECTTAATPETISAVAKVTVEDNKKVIDLGKFELTINGIKYNVSMNESDPDYIYKMFPVDPLMGSAPVYIEAVYDKALYKMLSEETATTSYTYTVTSRTDFYNYISTYRCAVTPWIVSEVKNASTEVIEVKKLFKVYTISDGNAANYQVKISIQRIRPIEGLFDLVVRDFYDTDESQIVLERFTNVSMVEGESNFVGLKVGTIDGSYPNKSKFIALEFSGEEGIDDCVPCGFLGYPIPKYANNGVKMDYSSSTETYTKDVYFAGNSTDGAYGFFCFTESLGNKFIFISS